MTLLSPALAQYPNGNISFGAKGSLISVNAALLQVCHAQKASNGVDFPCPLGPGQLKDTGYDRSFYGSSTNIAATGWLQTVSPIDKPGSDITLLFTIWDMGDGLLDSTVLLDNFAFDVAPAQAASTQPVATPK